MLYNLVKPILFSLDAETAHHLIMRTLGAYGKLPFPASGPSKTSSVQVFGLKFENPLGLAAGMDKNADAVDGFGKLGFGFIEVGTITPRPQAGNPRPRLFRVRQAEGIINRMGFNNHGVVKLLENLRAVRYSGVLGINIGKNADTLQENAIDDYLDCLRQVYQRADYVTVNVSSPNTKGLRNLQQREVFAPFLRALKQEQQQLASQYQKLTPLLVKIAPDLSEAEVRDIAGLLVEEKIDGVIATNSTIDHSAVEHLPNGSETGGLTGVPVREKSLHVVRVLADALESRVPIVGCGGIFSLADADAMLKAGASLIQIYSGLVYRGPALVSEILSGLATGPVCETNSRLSAAA